MIGKTNAVSGGGAELRSQIVTSGYHIDATGTGTRSFDLSLTGLQPKQLYSCVLNPGDGAISASGMSLSSPDIKQGTCFKLPFSTNMYCCQFIPLKENLTLTVSWQRTGGTVTRTDYAVF